MTLSEVMTPEWPYTITCSSELRPGRRKEGADNNLRDPELSWWRTHTPAPGPGGAAQSPLRAREGSPGGSPAQPLPQPGTWLYKDQAGGRSCGLGQVSTATEAGGQEGPLHHPLPVSPRYGAAGNRA